MLALGQKLVQLPEGKIYLDAPIAMKVGDKRMADARVGVNVPDDILRGHARLGDQTVAGSLRVSHEMTATLTGPGFEIKATTPAQQTVAEGFPTVWEWEIKAEQDGAQELEATLYALVPGGGSGEARERIDSYTQKINVAVKEQTWGEWLKSTRAEIDAVKALGITIAGLATAVLGWFGISATRGKKRAARTRSNKSRTQAVKSGGTSA